MLFRSGLLLALNWLLYVHAVQSAQVVEASLGYFINPLVNVLLGVVVLREKLGLLPEGYNNTSVQMPGMMNRLFTAVMSSERWFLRWLRFPLGHSLIGIAEKPAKG